MVVRDDYGHDRECFVPLAGSYVAVGDRVVVTDNGDYKKVVKVVTRRL